MDAEVYFLKYAFPCTEGRLNRKELNQSEFDRLRNAAISGEKLSREELGKVYKTAIEALNDLAKETKKSPWSLETIAEYFLVRHNSLIDEGKYCYASLPGSIREFCKIYQAKVISQKNNVATVNYSGGKKIVITDLIPKIFSGDIVTIHQGYAVEVISNKNSLAHNYSNKIPA